MINSHPIRMYDDMPESIPWMWKFIPCEKFPNGGFAGAMMGRVLLLTSCCIINIDDRRRFVHIYKCLLCFLIRQWSTNLYSGSINSIGIYIAWISSHWLLSRNKSKLWTFDFFGNIRTMTYNSTYITMESADVYKSYGA